MADTQATLHTNRGDIVIDLFPNHAPRTVENFVGLAEGIAIYGLIIAVILIGRA